MTNTIAIRASEYWTQFEPYFPSQEREMRAAPVDGLPLARRIDHTLLRADAREHEIAGLCEEARTHGFAAVCINPYWVKMAARSLAGTEVAVCTVAGFPLGANQTVVKRAEAAQAIEDGAREIDMVLNIGALKSDLWEEVGLDILALSTLCHERGALLKVILETALLTEEEKIAACVLAKLAQADFVKTSTGFGPSGATAEDVRLLRQVVGETMGVKASGGIRSLETARAMVEAGATRLGTSSGVSLVQGAAT